MNIPAETSDNKEQARYVVTVYCNGRALARDLHVSQEQALALLEGRGPAPVAFDVGGLTRPQLDCLAFIRSFIAANHYSPSYREIANGLGLSSAANIGRRVEEMIARGLLTKTSRLRRGLRVTAQGLSVQI